MSFTDEQENKIRAMAAGLTMAAPHAHVAAANEAHSAATDTDTAAHLKTALDLLGVKINAILVTLEDFGLVAKS